MKEMLKATTLNSDLAQALRDIPFDTISAVSRAVSKSGINRNCL